jgi:acetyl-CoA C-acetyltransferase
MERVGIVGVGYEGFRPAITDVSTRELMYQASSKAYADAGVDPRKDVGSFICCTEDFWEGWAITDEMVPDQVGGARRPLFTVAGEGVTGLGHAVMHIRSGVADVVAVEAHSKAADVLDKQEVENLALDPAFLRVPGANADILAGLEMDGFMKQSGFGREDASMVVKTEMDAALRNPRGSYGAGLSLKEIAEAEPLSTPLRKYDRAEYAEGGIVMVLAGEKWIRKRRKDAIYVDGIAWRSSLPWYESGEVGVAGYARDAFKEVLKQARRGGMGSFDVLEVDDTYSYKLLQHLVSMGGTRKQARSLLKGGRPAINPSGGAIGCGNLLEATGLHRVLECVLQLRGTAGPIQVPKAKTAAALSWRGNPSGTGAAVALSRGA